MPLILGTNSIKATGYDVDNSCRFNNDSSDNLNRTPSSASNRRTFTFSTWFKLSGTDGAFISAGTDISNGPLFIIDILSGGNEGLLRVEDTVSGDNVIGLRTTRKIRDITGWMHLCVAIDTTQSTASDRVKVYINGTQETSFGTETYPTQNLELAINNTHEHRIGTRAANTSGKFFDGYMCETVLVDGSALAPTEFGEFDSDSPTIWKPKDVSGLTFGTNGFYLDYKDSSALGNDVSGNNNDWTVNNLTAVDQSTDTCTNNFATLNPLLFHTYSGTYSEGNLKIVASNDSWYADASTIAPSSGKFYMEVKVSAIGNFCALGVGAFPFSNVGHSQLIGELSNTIGWRNNGVLNQNGSAGTSLNSFTTNDIIGMYLDLDNGKFYFSKNGTLESSTGLSLTTGLEYFFVVNPRGSTLELNFGSPPYSVSSSNTDDNGYGNFEYSPNITGDGAAKKFYALNTKNLAEYG